MKAMQLRHSLKHLHEELRNSSGFDDHTQAHLSAVGSDIEQVLSQSGDATEYHASLLKRLEDSIHLIEVSHPRLTGLVNNVIAILNTMGI